MANATTLRRAKAQFKKSGPTIAPAEQRRLERQAELARRAQFAKDRDERRRKAEQGRVEKEKREVRARNQQGIGLATQMCGFSHTQKKMKSGMEGWLGMGGAGGGKKRKRDEEVPTEGKSNEEDDGESGVPVEKEAAEVPKASDSFGSAMSLDDEVLQQLDAPSEPSPKQQQPDGLSDKLLTEVTEDTVADSEAFNGCNSTSRKAEEEAEPSITPPTKRARTSPQQVDDFAEFIGGSTQIDRELSSLPMASASASFGLSAIPAHEFEISSDDLWETGLPKTTNPTIDDKEEVKVRDFAYATITFNGSIALAVPNAPDLARKSRTEKSIQRSFSRGPTFTGPSPKMTANTAAFTADQCSFTADYHDFGISTQLMREAIEDGEGDTESEDEDLFSQALEQAIIPDNVRMPPPPIRLSPRVFKPPTTNGLGILGLSTQDLNDAVLESDEETDEDSDDGLFSIALNRAVNDSKAAHQKPQNPLTPPSARKRSETLPRTTYHEFGLSTQLLQDAALDDVDLTDDDDDDTGL